jgi:hypothetical protein
VYDFAGRQAAFGTTVAVAGLTLIAVLVTIPLWKAASPQQRQEVLSKHMQRRQRASSNSTTGSSSSKGVDDTLQRCSTAPNKDDSTTSSFKSIASLQEADCRTSSSNEGPDAANSVPSLVSERQGSSSTSSLADLPTVLIHIAEPLEVALTSAVCKVCNEDSPADLSTLPVASGKAQVAHQLLTEEINNTGKQSVQPICQNKDNEHEAAQCFQGDLGLGEELIVHERLTMGAVLRVLADKVVLLQCLLLLSEQLLRSLLNILLPLAMTVNTWVVGMVFLVQVRGCLTTCWGTSHLSKREFCACASIYPPYICHLAATWTLMQPY